jgi:tetratricopeptide (TPR) repeat protein
VAIEGEGIGHGGTSDGTVAEGRPALARSGQPRALASTPPGGGSSPPKEATLARIELGAFEAIAPLGSGGMGEVWRGRHRESGVPVAIKFARREGDNWRLALSAFTDEVRSMARLDHPHIVRILDQGLVGEAAAQASDGRLHAEAPWVVMELAGGGSLDEAPPPKSFEELSGILTVLLDALGHAHARGVVHRDLKPANILVAGPADLRSGLKLTDFGLAHAAERFATDTDGESEPASGTPTYMAPEQIQGTWRDYGPWTDLYALGCVAWELSTGAPPYAGGSLMELLGAHLLGSPPAFRPRFATPAGFSDWLRVLLAKAPAARFPTAADALGALRSLGEEDGAFVQAPALLSVDDDTVELDAGPLGSTPTAAGAEGLVAADLRLQPEPAPTRAPGAARLELLGAGRSLFGLRPVPLVGRDALLQEAAALLAEVGRAGRPAALVLGGPAGTGKSRAAREIAAAAHEDGRAFVLRGEASDEDARRLGTALASHLRCRGLDAEATQRRLAQLLVGDDDDLAAVRSTLAHLFCGPGLPPATDRELACRTALRRLSLRRPLVVVLDDVHETPDTLGFLLRALNAGEATGPVLFLVTLRPEALPDRPDAANVMRRLAGRPDVHRRTLGALTPAATRRLVERLLGLEPELARVVGERSAGNPAFAVELVGDLVRRGRLRLGGAGWALPAGEAPALPSNLEAVWAERLARFLASQPASAAAALERAATLGLEIDEREWARACAGEGTDLPALRRDLLRAQLIEARPGGFALVHGMAREVLLRRAEDAGRAQAHHLRCAACLAGRPGELVDERLGHHLARAGQPERAAPALLRAAQWRHDAGDFRSALALLAARDEALDDAGEPPATTTRLEGAALRCRLLLDVSDMDALLAEIDAAVILAEELRDPAATQLRVTRAAANLQRGGRDDALADLDAADRELLARPNAGYRARWATVRSAAAGAVGDWEGARAWLELAERHEATFDDPLRLASTHRLLARAHQMLGGLDAAEAFARKALAGFSQPGGRLGRAHALNALGELARARGDARQAEEYYRAAIRGYTQTGSAIAEYARWNLGWLLTQRGEHDGAWHELERTRARCKAAGNRSLEAACHPPLLAVAAGRGDDEAWARHADGCRTLAEIGFADPDFVAACRVAARRQRRRGDAARAAEAEALAAALQP